MVTYPFLFHGAEDQAPNQIADCKHCRTIRGLLNVTHVLQRSSTIAMLLSAFSSLVFFCTVSSKRSQQSVGFDIENYRDMAKCFKLRNLYR